MLSMYVWRTKLYRITTAFNQAAGWGAALVLFAMMVLTFVDVGGRTLFNHPISGAFELTELMLAALIFLALPLVTASHSHVEVDLLDHFIPSRLQQLQRLVVRLVNLAVYGVLTWVLIEHTVRAYEYGDVTSALEIPLVGLGVVMVVGCVLTTLTLALAPLCYGSSEKIEEDLF